MDFNTVGGTRCTISYPLTGTFIVGTNYYMTFRLLDNNSHFTDLNGGAWTITANDSITGTVSTSNAVGLFLLGIIIAVICGLGLTFIDEPLTQQKPGISKITAGFPTAAASRAVFPNVS